MSLFQLIFGTLCLVFSLRTVWKVTRVHTSWLGALFWSIVWASAAFLIFFPASTVYVARAFGITRGVDLVIYLAILGGILAVRYFYNRCRRLESMITQVVRERAIADCYRLVSERDI